MGAWSRSPAHVLSLMEPVPHEPGQRVAPGMAVSWWVLSKTTTTSSFHNLLCCCPLRLHRMQSGMRSMEKELDHPLWSCSGDRRSFKIKSGVVLCERDMPGSPVPEVNPAGFTKSSEAQRWGGNFNSISSKSHSLA